ncbi:MAG TPA: small ribosomal subunit Rsm22 family protein [Pseudolabrys sp.]|nr:small ribosomal subunit Rsm22 family protein [Pseudolabrys sp.]
MPTWISAALQSKLENVSRAALRERAQAISERYRAGGNSDVIRSEFDALAYAVVRMPATYAAVRAALAYCVEIIPEFAPQSVLDVGAGPGTASWAAVDAWPSVRRTALADSNPQLLELARQFHNSATASDFDVTLMRGNISASLGDTPTAALVLASYVLGELAATSLDHVVGNLWKLTDALLVIVEPGTPAGFKRVLQCRDALLASGAHIIAPCSHDGLCPLSASDRWCHFSARLPRSRDHQITKGARVPYEDEKFSYLIAGKASADVKRGRRILATPKVTKAAVMLTLCAPGTPAECVIARQRKDAYKAAKRYDWGDAIKS